MERLNGITDTFGNAGDNNRWVAIQSGADEDAPDTYVATDNDTTGLAIVIKSVRSAVIDCIGGLDAAQLRGDTLRAHLGTILDGVDALNDRYQQWMRSCTGMMWRGMTFQLCTEPREVRRCDALHYQLLGMDTVLQALPSEYDAAAVPNPLTLQNELRNFITACCNQLELGDRRITDFFTALANRYPLPPCVVTALQNPEHADTGLQALLERIDDGTALVEICTPFLQGQTQSAAEALNGNNPNQLRAELSRYLTCFGILRTLVDDCVPPADWNGNATLDALTAEIADNEQREALSAAVIDGSRIVTLFADAEVRLGAAKHDYFNADGNLDELMTLVNLLKQLRALNGATYTATFSEECRQFVGSPVTTEAGLAFAKDLQIAIGNANIALNTPNTRYQDLRLALLPLLTLVQAHSQGEVNASLNHFACDANLKVLLEDQHACKRLASRLNGHHIPAAEPTAIERAVQATAVKSGDGVVPINAHNTYGPWMLTHTVKAKTHEGWLKIGVEALPLLVELAQKEPLKAAGIQIEGKLSESDLAHLFALMKACPDLRVNVINNDMEPTTLKLAGLAFMWGDNLHNLLARMQFVGNTIVDAEGFLATDETLQAISLSFPDAVCVSLKGCESIDDDSVTALAAALPKLRELLLHGASIDDAVILPALATQCLHITRIWNSEGNTAAFELACAQVTELEFGNPTRPHIPLTDFEALLNRYAGVTHLIVHPSADLGSIDDLLLAAPQLTGDRAITVTLPENMRHLTDITIPQMSQATCLSVLSQLPELRQLRLNGMMLTPELTAALLQLEHLRALDISTCVGGTCDILHRLVLIPSLQRARVPAALPVGEIPLNTLRCSKPMLLRDFANCVHFQAHALNAFTGPKELLFLIQQHLTGLGIDAVFPADHTEMDPDSLFFWLHQHQYLMGDMPVNATCRNLIANDNPLVNAHTAVHLPSKFPNVRKMSFRRCSELTAAACGTLVDRLVYCGNIERLDLSGCKQVDDSTFYTHAGPKILPQGLYLNLTRTGVGQETRDALLAANWERNVTIVWEDPEFLGRREELALDPGESPVTFRSGEHSRIANRALVAQRWAVGDAEQIDVGPGTSAAALECLAQFLYTGEILSPLTPTLAIELYRIGNQHHQAGLMDRCESYLKRSITAANIGDIWTFANTYDRKDLRTQCWLYAQANLQGSALLQHKLILSANIEPLSEVSADVTISLLDQAMPFHKRVLMSNCGRLQTYLSEGGDGYNMGEVEFDLEDPDLAGEDLATIHSILYQRRPAFLESDIADLDIGVLAGRITRLLAAARALEWSALVLQLETALLRTIEVRAGDELGWIPALAETYGLPQVTAAYQVHQDAVFAAGLVE